MAAAVERRLPKTRRSFSYALLAFVSLAPSFATPQVDALNEPPPSVDPADAPIDAPLRPAAVIGRVRRFTGS